MPRTKALQASRFETWLPTSPSLADMPVRALASTTGFEAARWKRELSRADFNVVRRTSRVEALFIAAGKGVARPTAIRTGMPGTLDWTALSVQPRGRRLLGQERCHPKHCTPCEMPPPGWFTTQGLCLGLKGANHREERLPQIRRIGHGRCKSRSATIAIDPGA